MAIPKPIEEIQVGDRVLSYNEETGQNQVKIVRQTFTSSHEKVVKVRQSNGQVITSSYGHPYYTKRGWIAAENLKAGDILQTVNGETVVVEFVEHVLLESSVTLYNFEVDGNHNYYVADSVHADTSEFVLVHNKGCNKLKPDPNATGSHTTFKRDPVTGEIKSYTTWEFNSKNPTRFQELKRFDRFGEQHYNKVIKKYITSPHVHDKYTPGEIRFPESWEIPKIIK